MRSVRRLRERAELKTESPFRFVFRDEENRREWVHCSLKLVVSNGPSGLEAPHPLGFVGLKVLGLKHRESSDCWCEGSAGLETPRAFRGDGVMSPSGFEMPKVFGSAVSRTGANDLRVCGVEGPKEGSAMSMTFGSEVSEPSGSSRGRRFSGRGV